MIIPTAEPFFFPGGRTGCLLIHGFTGSPKEMRWMGEHLAGAGHTVLGVRLPGHATQMEDMERVRWQDWLACVEDGWNLLRGTTRQIFLLGLSMGGALSLLFASRQPVTGLVAISTPNELPADWRLPFIKILCWFQPSVPKGPPDWRNLEAARDHVDYPVYPTRAIIQLRDLMAEMRTALPQVRAPVLLVHSRADQGVVPANLHKIYERLGSADKRVLWVENCGHVVTREPERFRVFQESAEFIQRVSAARG
jgi:carboxylesterase